MKKDTSVHLNHQQDEVEYPNPITENFLEFVTFVPRVFDGDRQTIEAMIFNPEERNAFLQREVSGLLTDLHARVKDIKDRIFS